MPDTTPFAVLLRERRADLLVELAGIEAALLRIEQGQYGRCEYCGQAISRERLALVPATRWCSACKRDFALRRGIH